MVKSLMNRGELKSTEEGFGLSAPLQVGTEEWKLQSRGCKISLIQGKH